MVLGLITRKTNRRSSTGVGGIDFLVVFSTLSVLLGFIAPNYGRIQARNRDHVAYQDYQQIKQRLSARRQARHPAGSFFIFNQVGPDPLPEPFNNIILNEKIRLHYALQLDLLGFRFNAIKLSHDKGRHYYRLFECNEQTVEQIIRK